MEWLFVRAARAAALAIPLLLAAIVAALFWGAWPAFRAFGLHFLFSQAWNPVTGQFGALAPVYGTVIVSLMAMTLAVPLSLGVAIFLTELCPPLFSRPIGLAIEMLAGIPSIVFGFWGLFVLAPFLQTRIEPGLISVFANVPLLSALFKGPPFGIGMATAGLVLAIMVLPLISAVARDGFMATPRVLIEAAHGLGCSRWETIRHVILPYARRAIAGGVMLGLGRALGETMAVTFVVGNSPRISASLFAPGTTISATIANEFAEATGPLYTASLIALGLVLFAITFAVLLAARVLIHRPLKASA